LVEILLNPNKSEKILEYNIKKFYDDSPLILKEIQRKLESINNNMVELYWIRSEIGEIIPFDKFKNLTEKQMCQIIDNDIKIPKIINIICELIK